MVQNHNSIVAQEYVILTIWFRGWLKWLKKKEHDYSSLVFCNEKIETNYERRERERERERERQSEEGYIGEGGRWVPKSLISRRFKEFKGVQEMLKRSGTFTILKSRRN